MRLVSLLVIMLAGTLTAIGAAHAEPPGDASPLPAGPDGAAAPLAPPVVAPGPAGSPAGPAAVTPALPAGVTPVDDPRRVTFVLSGGNRIVARRIGEDPEFIWVDSEGQLARIRKSEIVTMEFQTAPPRPPVVTATAPPPTLVYAAPPPRVAHPGRSMMVWGAVLFGVGYTLAILAAMDETTGIDGTSFLLAIPAVGPFIFAATPAADHQPAPYVLDGLLQVGGLVLIYFGLRRMNEASDEEPSRVPRVGLSVGQHGAFARATWAL